MKTDNLWKKKLFMQFASSFLYSTPLIKFNVVLYFSSKCQTVIDRFSVAAVLHAPALTLTMAGRGRFFSPKHPDFL
jgi:hypothetical protein